MKQKQVMIITMLSSLLLVILSISSSAMVAPSSFVHQKTVVQSSILHVGDDSPGSYDSIRTAINDAQNGDTVYVHDESSPYYERITIDKQITLQGEDKHSTVIDGSNQGTVVILTADGINLSGFTIQHSGNAVQDAGVKANSDNNIIHDLIFIDNTIGMRFEYAHNIVFYSNTINDQIQKGISIIDSSDIIMYENTINNNQIGVHLAKNANYNTIYANAILNNDKGIYLESSAHNAIYWNIVTNADYGIYLDESSSNEIYDENVITDNMVGILLTDSFSNRIYDGNIISHNQKGILLTNSDSNAISQNDIQENDEGIYINRSDQNDIYWNQIINNVFGVYVFNSDHNELYLNQIQDNLQFGLYLDMSSRTKITYNNFIDNYIHASFVQSFLSLNRWKQNYWNKWNGNGIYRISGDLKDFAFADTWSSIDFRPAKTPYNI